ncbi:U-box domain-containing protein 26-like [Carica papaya]|uniref:U-box domain-containing protein 26-like n=1 Tax=Carica papaya TaxID=3649 RepID=UPI000B8CA245|nr:U-box domain-containing protein 26-like [Carica papaya]
MKESQMSIPHLFRCPISLDLLTDPVTLCTGQTYERQSIEKWLAAGNLTCPVTMQKLQDPTIVPNHTLRHLIHQWLQMGSHFQPDYFSKIDSLASIKHTLQSPQSTINNKLSAVEQLQLLLQESSSSSSSPTPITSCLIQLEFLPLILELLFGKVEIRPSWEYITFVEHIGCCVLTLLPLGDLQVLNMLQEESKMEAFLVLLEQGSSIIKKNLCNIVEITSSSTLTKELCEKLGKNQRLLQDIVFLVYHNSEEANYGIKAISALCCLDSNHENLVKFGAINGLITYILNADKQETNLAAIAVGRIEQLLRLESSKSALMENPEGINGVVKMVFRVSDHEGSGSAINSLMMICEESLQAREKAIKGGVLTQLLLLIQSQCSSRTKTKARMLLKLLRSNS